MATYQELLARKRLLDIQIEHAKARERNEALHIIDQLVKMHGFTQADIFKTTARTSRVRG